MIAWIIWVTGNNLEEQEGRRCGLFIRADIATVMSAKAGIPCLSVIIQKSLDFRLPENNASTARAKLKLAPTHPLAVQAPQSRDKSHGILSVPPENPSSARRTALRFSPLQPFLLAEEAIGCLANRHATANGLPHPDGCCPGARLLRA